MDILKGEAARIGTGIDVAGRRTDHHMGGDCSGRLAIGQGADHRADGVPHQHHRAHGVFINNLAQVMGVAGE